MWNVESRRVKIFLRENPCFFNVCGCHKISRKPWMKKQFLVQSFLPPLVHAASMLVPEQWHDFAHRRKSLVSLNQLAHFLSFPVFLRIIHNSGWYLIITFTFLFAFNPTVIFVRKRKYTYVYVCFWCLELIFICAFTKYFAPLVLYSSRFIHFGRLFLQFNRSWQPVKLLNLI